MKVTYLLNCQIMTNFDTVCPQHKLADSYTMHNKISPYICSIRGCKRGFSDKDYYVRYGDETNSHQ